MNNTTFTQRSLLLIASLAWIAAPRAQAHDHYFDWYADVSYLRWKATEDQLQYGVFLPQGVLPNDAQPFVERFLPINQHFNFDNGVRLTAGSIIDNNWDAAVVWTHFKQKAYTHLVDPRSQHIIAAPLSQAIGAAFIFSDKANSCLRLTYDTVEINASQWYEINECTKLNILLGIIIGQIKQKQSIEFGQIPIAQDLTFTNSHVNRCNDFIGAGPQLAGSLSWHHCDNWSLFAGASGALLAGKCKTNTVNFLSTETNVQAPACCTKDMVCRDINPSNEVYLDGEHGIIHWFNASEINDNEDPAFTIIVNNRKGCVRPHAMLNAGLAWENSFCHWLDAYASISFEIHFWPEQWQVTPSLFNVVANTWPGAGNLGLYGATFSFGITF